MSDIADELDANSEKFLQSWAKNIASNIGLLAKNEKFRLSYRRIAAIQAIRVFLIGPLCPAGSASFFTEAQNDALTSHVLASCGAWRPSLKVLRSFIEDLFGCLYFADHPVELRLWESGEFRLGFTATHNYFIKHPNLEKISSDLSGLEVLKAEYATLSKAVHGSAKNFRMTDDSAALLLWSADAAKLGAWDTRHRKVIEAGCLLIVSLFADQLKGAAHAPLRAILGHAICSQKRLQLKDALHIHIDEP